MIVTSEAGVRRSVVMVASSAISTGSGALSLKVDSRALASKSILLDVKDDVVVGATSAECDNSNNDCYFWNTVGSCFGLS